MKGMNIMKKSMKTLAIISAAVMSFSAMPAASLYAADSTSSVSASESTAQTVKYGKVTAISGTKVKLALGEYSQSSAPDNSQSNGQEPPAMPDGNGQNGTPPEMPEQGITGNGEQPPEKPDGEAPDGMGSPFGEFTLGGKTITINITNEKLLKKNGRSASLSDISEGDILKLTYNSNNKISGIEILSGGMDKPQGGESGASGGMQQQGSKV